MAKQLRQGASFLAEHGLNLLAVFDCAELPAPVAGLMDAVVPDWRRWPRLMLIGSGGPEFWRALQRHGPADADPVDRFSRACAGEFVRDYLDDPPVRWLYPGDTMVPLQRLGVLAGWHHSSPLGIGINACYGLWFAYRAACLIDRPLPVTPPWTGGSPCERCAGKPCVSACPAGAVAAAAAFSVQRCAGHRLVPDSSCARTCLARLACPVAAEQRYPPEQIGHHYRVALDSLRRWYGLSTR